MTIAFGLGLASGPLKGQHNRWMDNLDASLPQLAGHIKSLWMTDHFAWNEMPTYEAWTVLAYLAARWPQFDVGPMVLGQSYRNPALLAKMGATLQNLSGGRFVMGIGAGWKEDEYRAYGYPYPGAKTRLEQLEDTLEILKRMWTSPGKVTYQGQHYRVVDAFCESKPDPLPPIMVGGGGKTTMLLAARYADWWNLSDASIERYTERMNILKGHCETISRDPATLRLTWFGRLAVGRTEAEARERALNHGREHYDEWTLENAFVGTPGQVVDQMGAFVEAGVDYFMFDILGLPDQEIIGMVVEDVLPKVGK